MVQGDNDQIQGSQRSTMYKAMTGTYKTPMTNSPWPPTRTEVKCPEHTLLHEHAASHLQINIYVLNHDYF